MIKKIIFGITILLNIILSVVLVFTIIRSENEITSNYDEDALTEVADHPLRPNWSVRTSATLGQEPVRGVTEHRDRKAAKTIISSANILTGCSSGNSTKLQVTGIP